MQDELGIVMNRLFLAAGLLVLAGCESAPEAVPPKEAAFVTDDCALITAIGREQFKLSADDPQMTITLNGEDAPWRPGGGEFRWVQRFQASSSSAIAP